MNRLYSELGWLERAPHDFAARLYALNCTSGPTGLDIRELATYSLDVVQLINLAKVVDKVRVERKSLEPLEPFRLAILSNSATEFIAPALIASSARHDLLLEVIVPSHNQVAQESLADDSKVNKSKPTAVLFALDYRALPLKLSLGNDKASSATVREAIAYLQTLRSAIKDHSGAICIFQTFVPPIETLFGSFDRALPGTPRNVIDAINRELVEYVYSSGDIILDVAALAETVGVEEWQNTRQWNMAKMPFSDKFVPIYADYTARILGAMCGKSRKVLVLDLDNVVWGGVIGDDGLEGIKVARGDERGEAHLAVQRLALELRQRGILLAVSSKNDDEVARRPFEKHPEMLLKLEHIAVFQANWNDKAANIKAIADELSLGLDAFVFLEDSPVERGLVRKLLPQVAVPELPEDPAYFARTLTAAGYFEAVAVSHEDLERAKFYELNAKRIQVQMQFEGVEAYLASLEMKIYLQPFNSIGRARIVQLVNRCNQYNLTGCRCTSAEVAAAESDPRVFTLQARLVDKYGDSGVISAVVCRQNCTDVWDIDIWVMSCRVLGRKVEGVVMRKLLEEASGAGIQKIIGVYRPTTRNKLASDHYAKLGFCQVSVEDTELTKWEILVQDAELDKVPIEAVSQGFCDSRSGTDGPG